MALVAGTLLGLELTHVLGEPAPATGPTGAISFAQIEGYWIAAGGPSSTAVTAAAITGAESSFEPGAIQYGPLAYCSTGADKTGWGLWQITCGDSVPQYGEDYQLLDPWNNAEAAVAKYVGAGDSFSPWTTYNDGSYKNYIPKTPPPPSSVTDLGEFNWTDGPPPTSGEHNKSQPGTTYGPALPEPGVSAVVMAGREDIFTVGEAGVLYQDSRPIGGTWGGWRQVPIPGGDVFASAPAVVTPSAGEIDVFGRGTNGALWEAKYTGSWSATISLGGVTSYGPGAVVFSAKKQVAVFVIATNGTLYEDVAPIGGTFKGWSQVPIPGGDVFVSAPAVVALNSAEFDVFGLGTNGATWGVRDTTSWSSTFTLGGGTLFGPAAVKLTNTKQEAVFVTGAGGAIYQDIAPIGGPFKGWTKVPASGVYVSPLGIETPTATSLDLFGTGTNGNIFTVTHTTTWSNPTNLGGNNM